VSVAAFWSTGGGGTSAIAGTVNNNEAAKPALITRISIDMTMAPGSRLKKNSR
jgi:hypothetical protein